MHRPIPQKLAMAIVTAARKAYPPVLVSAEILDRWYTDRYDAAYATEVSRQYQPDVVGPSPRGSLSRSPSCCCWASPSG